MINNKGFGLPELLLFIGISMFLLISITIYCNNKFNYDDIMISNVEPSNESLVPSIVEIPKEYEKLEIELKNISKSYKFNKNEDIIISLDKLKKVGLINQIKDPNDSSIICNGYVVYDSDKKEYKSYINCPGMYVTNNYNSEFE